MGKRSQSGQLSLQIESVGESQLSFPDQKFLLLPNRKQRVELTPEFLETKEKKCSSVEVVILEMQSNIPIDLQTTSK